MRTGVLMLALALWMASPRVSSAELSFSSVEEVRSAVEAHLAQERFAAATWGVAAASLETGAVLVEHNAGKLLKPASNAKLFSGALALDRLGPEFRFETTLLAEAAPGPDGVLEGDLIVYGRGDPTFSNRFFDGEYGRSLPPLVEVMKRAGIRRVRGRLIGDETYFAGPRQGAGWMWEDLQYYYGAEVSALSFQDNAVDLVVTPGAAEGDPCRIETRPATRFLEFINKTQTAPAGQPQWVEVHRPIGSRVVHVNGRVPLGAGPALEAVAVADPALWMMTQLREAMLLEGIVLEGGVGTRSWLDEGGATDIAKLRELGVHTSRPLREILPKMMKPSQNQYAQLLLLQVGRRLEAGAGRRNTTESLGLAELRRFLSEVGVPPGQERLEEGSGLSRGALVAPAAILKLLVHMDRHPQREVFLDSLPVGGVDGTLRNRFKEPPLKGNVRAKTGTINYVNTLSGYVASAAGERLVFSIMLNAHSPAGGAPSAREDVDTVVRLLAGLAVKTGPAAAGP